MIFSKIALKAVALLAGCIVAASANTLDMTVLGSVVTLDEADQVNYDQNQNPNGGAVAFNGTTVTLDGNMWKAVEIPGGGVLVTEGTILRFTFDLHEAGEFQAICLDENLELSPQSGATDFASGRRCFALANTQSWVNNLIYAPHLVEPGDDPLQFSIPIGHYFTGQMKYVAFLQDNDADRSVGLSEFRDIEIVNEETTTLDIDVRGQVVNVPAHPQLDYYISNPYDQDSRFWVMHVSENGDSVQMSGNQYKALELPGDGVDIGIETVLAFDFSLQYEEEVHGICLDEDTHLVSDPKRCFSLAGTQNVGNYIHVFDKTKVGTTHHYEIPIGMFFRDITAKFLAFTQDNDKSDKSTGMSTFSNIRIYDVPRPSLNITVYDSEMIIDNTPLEYEEGEGTYHYPLEVSSDGKTVDLAGNTHQALELPSPITITEATELDFDFTLNELADYHTVCLDEDLVYNNNKRCFLIAHEQRTSSFYSLDPQTKEIGEKVHYNVRVGLKYTGTFNYLVFVQDSDKGDKSGGSSTISNIVISERPALKLAVSGSTASSAATSVGTSTGIIALQNYQLTYESTSQDTVDNLMVVSEDGESISMSGNLWKALEIPGGLVVGEDTVLAFDFTLDDETEIHALCLDEDLSDDTDGARCFKVAGTQTDNLGDNVVYRNVRPTHEGESRSYMIKLSEYFTGTMKYLVFMHDNDSNDRTTGLSSYSNIRVFESESCLSETTFNFDVAECTAETFTSKIKTQLQSNGCANEDPWAELLASFGVIHEHQVRDKIGEICGSAHGFNYLPFNEVTGEEHQFTAEYLDGGTAWNYGHETDLGGGTVLNKSASKVEEVHQAIAATPRGISMPDVHNFHGCELRAAMCCFVSRREVLNGDPEFEDNSDACYMDFKKARQSSHVRDGYSIYGNGTEGNLNCHGFAWGNDVGYADAAFRGNNLFEVAMKKKLYDNGFVEELPGAPLCGCVEQMPVVTKAACTDVQAVQNVAVRYDAAAASFSAEVEITSITHSDCTDLSTHYGLLVAGGKATAREKALLDEHLVGDTCDAALVSFLESKGFVWPE